MCQPCNKKVIMLLVFNQQYIKGKIKNSVVEVTKHETYDKDTYY